MSTFAATVKQLKQTSLLHAPMADASEPQNRRQRRAAARNTTKAGHPDQGATDFKLAQPDRSGPKGKTLFELAEERQALLDKGKPFQKDEELEKLAERDFVFSGDPIGPAGEAVLYGSTLSMLHFTLDVLVYNQYRQAIEWSEIFSRIGRIIPVLFVIVYMLHTKTAARFPLVKQLLFLITSITAGCYMVYSGNTYGYFAVMKRAPPVGTLWVWSVIEMQLVYAVSSLIVVGVYTWWNGFKTF